MPAEPIKRDRHGKHGLQAKLLRISHGCAAVLLQSVLCLLGAGAQAQILPSDCQPQSRGQMQLQALQGQFYTVHGRLGGFDPCEAQVRFRLASTGAEKAPLVISVHGGGGIVDVRASDDAFYAAGYSTLIFDAYAMQGMPTRPSVFWARSVSNEARQRMIYASALAAYDWARQRQDIDAERIYFFGVSNGAAVVANLAAVVDPKHVRGVIAEGITPIGLGLPDRIRVPILLAFGRLDDFGSPDPAMLRWDLSDDCRLNVRVEGLPEGSAWRCNANTPGKKIPSPLQWAEAVRLQGGRVDVAYFDDMAHNAFWGPLRQQKATWASGKTYGASLGASDEARSAFMRAMLAFIQQNGKR